MSGLVVFVLVALMGLLNIWCFRHRKKLTPEQRREEDEAMLFDQSVW